MSEKISMVRIDFPSGEYDVHNPYPETFYAWDEADTFLSHIGQSKKDQIGCLKVDFKIHFSDGFAYDGTYEVKKDEMACLSEHVLDFCRYYSGNINYEDLPDHLKKRFKNIDEYRCFLKENYGISTMQNFENILRNYQIGNIH